MMRNDRCNSVFYTWIHDLPDEEANERIKRYESNNEASRESAFFEVYLFQLFKKIGWKVKLHPELENVTSKPDFLVQNSQGRPLFFLEAKVILDSDKQRRKSRVSSEICRFLKNENEVEFLKGYFIHFDVKSIGTGSFSKRRLAAFLDKVKDNNDETIFEDNGWRITFAIRKTKNCDIVNVSCTEFLGLLDTSEKFKQSIEEKSTKYGKQFNIPFLVAFNIRRHLGIDDDEIVEALFGRFVWVFNRNNPANGYTTLEPNGAFLKNKWEHVNGVVIFNNLHESNYTHIEPTLWKNPYAKAKQASTRDFWPFTLKYIDEDGRLKTKRGKIDLTELFERSSMES